jgi:glucose/arabinose dehydrogenase
MLKLISADFRLEEPCAGLTKSILAAVFVLFSGLAYSQSAQLTPEIDPGMHTVAVGVPTKYTGNFPAGRTLKVDTNYTVSIFHAGGLSKPRFMAFNSIGVLHVSDMNAGKVFALPDVNQDGVADTMIEAATGFTGNHDIKFYKSDMYVTEATTIWKCADTDGDGVYETKTVFISNIGNNQTNGHTTRTIVFDSINQKAYVSVGSSCNICREEDRAIIEQYNEDGTGRRVFSSGIRNAIGMVLHPITNRLWANNNGSDGQGNETPPEWIDIVRDGGFYGHPFAYGGGVWFDFNANSAYQALLPITAADSAKVATVVQPAALIRAHSAPMAIEFLNSTFGPDMQHGFLTALRGSWNTTNPNDFRGYKVIYGHLSAAEDTTVDYVAEFCSGFLTDSINRIFWGRPVGIATDGQGKVYVSSDETNRIILVFTPSGATGIENQEAPRMGSVYPNPVKNQFTLPLVLNQAAKVRIALYDVTGREVLRLRDQTMQAGSHSEQFNVHGIIPGLYFLMVNAGSYSVKETLVIQ